MDPFISSSPSQNCPEEEGALSWVPTASRASGKPTRVTEREGSGFEEQCLSFPPHIDLGGARASGLTHSCSESLRKLAVEGWEMEAQASSRASSAWTGTAALRRQGQPSLSGCPRRKGQGSGVKAAHFLPQPLWKRESCWVSLRGC